MTADDDNPAVSTSPPPVVEVKKSPSTSPPPPPYPTPVATAAEILLEEFIVYVQHPDRKLMCLRVMEAMLPTVAANSSLPPPLPRPLAPPTIRGDEVSLQYELWKAGLAGVEMKWDKAEEFYGYEEEDDL